jgi:DNA-binding MarR family transcriptional regulator
MFDPSLDYGLLPSLTGFALRRASLLDFAKFGEALGDKAITPLRYSMLEVVGANPGLPQVQLADILGLSKPAATLALDFWQSRKCITRRKDARDRRSHGIFLTETGKQALAGLQQRVSAHDMELTSNLTNEELANLRSYLRKIYEA